MKLVLDWDGTVTARDTQWMVIEHFGDPTVFERADAALERGASLREIMALEFATVEAPLEEIVPWLVEHARIRPGFRELVEEHRPTVLSSGFEEMIRPVLARENIDVELVANRIERSGDGWRIRWRDETVCAHCDEACKRGALPAGDVAYVGDGYSDRCAALAATRVFARDGLADYLEREGAAFERWDDFFDVARALGGADVDERTTSRGLK